MQDKLLTAGFILLLLLTGGCRNKPVDAKQSAYTIKNDSIYLHDVSSVMQIVKIGSPQKESVPKEITTAGTIQAIPTQLAYIAPPFDGRITKSHIKIGQQVSALTPLFEMISHDFTALQKEYYQAEAERELARKDLVRKEELKRNNLCSEREYEETINAMKQADKEYENARATFGIHHVNPDNMTLGQPLIIRAPIAGEVIENNIVNGLYLESGAEPVSVIANLNDVWVTAQVKEKDIRFIQTGDKMTIHVNAFPEKAIEGTVFHIDGAVDEDTRSIRVISVCDNRKENLKIGMYATVIFSGTKEEYVVIPEKAIMQGKDNSYVIVQVNDSCFVRKSVLVDFTKNGNAYVSEGLNPEDRIICEGGYYLQ